MPAEPNPLLHLELPRRPDAGQLARDALSGSLGGTDAEAALPDLLMVTSELVNNAVLHGRGRIEVRVGLHEDVVRVEVVDEGDGQAVRIRGAAGDASGGFGLRLVDAVSSRWGVFEGTTHVWADVPFASA